MGACCGRVAAAETVTNETEVTVSTTTMPAAQGAPSANSHIPGTAAEPILSDEPLVLVLNTSSVYSMSGGSRPAVASEGVSLLHADRVPAATLQAGESEAARLAGMTLATFEGGFSSTARKSDAEFVPVYLPRGVPSSSAASPAGEPCEVVLRLPTLDSGQISTTDKAMTAAEFSAAQLLRQPSQTQQQLPQTQGSQVSDMFYVSTEDELQSRRAPTDSRSILDIYGLGASIPGA